MKTMSKLTGAAILLLCLAEVLMLSPALAADTTPPVIISPARQVGGFTDSAFLEWVTDEPTTATVRYGTAPGALDQLLEWTDLLEYRLIEVTGLSAGTWYYFNLEVADAAGNTTTTHAEAGLFKTAAPGEEKLPEATCISFNWLSPITVEIEIVTSTYSTASVTYDAAPDCDEYGPYTSSTYGNHHFIVVDELVPLLEYRFRLTLTDLRGNQASSDCLPIESYTQGAPLGAMLAQDPQVIDGPGLAYVSDQAAVVFWVTDQRCTGSVTWWLASNPATTYSADDLTVAPGGLYEHWVVLTGLQPSGQYVYTVASGGVTNPGEREFYAQSGGDSTPPTLAFTPGAYPGGDRVVIYWGTDEWADAQIRFGPTIDYSEMWVSTLAAGAFLSDDDYMELDHHTVVIGGLSVGSEYHFSVSGVDLFGNAFQSPDYSFIATEDHTPPAISEVHCEINPLGCYDAVWTTDEPAFGMVLYGDDLEYSSFETGLRTTHRVTLKVSEQGKSCRVRIISTDLFDNSGEADDTFRRFPPVEIALAMPAASFAEGDTCGLSLQIDNPWDAHDVDLYVLLDVFGDYWCYPSWQNIALGVDCQRLSVPGAYSGSMDLIPPFVMPPVSAVGPLYFYAAMFDPDELDLYHLASNGALFEFSLSP